MRWRFNFVVIFFLTATSAFATEDLDYRTADAITPRGRCAKALRKMAPFLAGLAATTGSFKWASVQFGGVAGMYDQFAFHVLPNQQRLDALDDAEHAGGIRAAQAKLVSTKILLAGLEDSKVPGAKRAEILHRLAINQWASLPNRLDLIRPYLQSSDPELRRKAALLIAESTSSPTDLENVLLALVHAGDRSYALQLLNERDRHNGVPHFKVWSPELSQSIRDGLHHPHDSTELTYAIGAVTTLSNLSDEDVEKVYQYATSQNLDSVQTAAIMALGSFGPRAQFAGPKIAEIGLANLAKSNAIYRSVALTLKKIDAPSNLAISYGLAGLDLFDENDRGAANQIFGQYQNDLASFDASKISFKTLRGGLNHNSDFAYSRDVFRMMKAAYPKETDEFLEDLKKSQYAKYWLNLFK